MDYPTSVEERVLQYLQAGGRLTPLDALRMWGCFRLGARICDLKKQGHRIEARTIETENGKHVAEYRLQHDGQLF